MEDENSIIRIKTISKEHDGSFTYKVEEITVSQFYARTSFSVYNQKVERLPYRWYEFIWVRRFFRRFKRKKKTKDEVELEILRLKKTKLLWGLVGMLIGSIISLIIQLPTILEKLNELKSKQ